MVEQVMDMILRSLPDKSALLDTIVDGTVGGGGHAAVLLQRLSPMGRMVCFDRDPEALKMARKQIGEDVRVTYIQESYSEIRKHLKQNSVDVILLDFGLSTDQLESERGFSYMRDYPLDMRFDPRLTSSAFDVVNEYSTAELRDVFFKYGEEPMSPRIATRIVEARKSVAIETTRQLAESIRGSVPERFYIKALSRIFQALRIEVNQELEHLEKGLAEGWEVLKAGGVFCVLTYHSLEDRRAKRFFAAKSKGCTCPPTLPICVCNKKPEAKILGASFRPTPKEIRLNPQARSARLRAALKIPVHGRES